MLEQLTVEITRKCLNRCNYCSSLAEQYPAEQPLSSDAVIGLVREASTLGLASLSISGGEPFLHPEIGEIISAPEVQRLPDLRVYTSGIVLGTTGAAASLSAGTCQLVARAGARLIFNVQSNRPEVHDAIVGAEGRWDLLVRSIQMALSSGVVTECHLVPHRCNSADLEGTTRWLLALGIERVSFLRLVPQGYAYDNRNDLVLEAEDQAEVRKRLTALAQESGSSCRIGVPFSDGRDMSRCQAGVSKLIVRWDGTYLPCEAFKVSGHDEFDLGKIGATPVSVVLARAKNNLALQRLKDECGAEEPCPAQRLYSCILER